MSIPTEHWANVQPTVATLLCLMLNNKVVGCLTVWQSFKRLASCGMHALMLQRSNEGLLAVLGVSGSEYSGPRLAHFPALKPISRYESD